MAIISSPTSWMVDRINPHSRRSSTGSKRQVISGAGRSLSRFRGLTSEMRDRSLPVEFGLRSLPRREAARPGIAAAPFIAGSGSLPSRIRSQRRGHRERRAATATLRRLG